MNLEFGISRIWNSQNSRILKFSNSEPNYEEFPKFSNSEILEFWWFPDSGESSGWVNYWALVNGRDSTDFTRGHFRGFLTFFWFNLLVTNLFSVYLVVSALRDFPPCRTTLTKLYWVDFLVRQGGGWTLPVLCLSSMAYTLFYVPHPFHDRSPVGWHHLF